MALLICAKCDIEYIGRRSKRSRHTFCSRKCSTAYRVEHLPLKPTGSRYMRWVRANREKERAKRIRSMSQPWYLYAHLKGGAKARGLRFEISKEEYLLFWRKPCHYCGAEIERCGIDRIDSSRGYVIWNIVSCCYRCNLMKREMSQDDFLAQCKRIVSHFRNESEDATDGPIPIAA